LFANANTYYITFDNIMGLGASTPIYADGFKVGTVKNIVFDYGELGPIKIEIELNQAMRVPVGTTAEIDKDLMGNTQINLLIADNKSKWLSPGDIISGKVAEGVMTKAAGLIPEVEKMMPKVDSILDRLNMILADPNIGKSLGNIQQTTANLAVSTQELNTLLRGLNHSVPGMINKANGVLDNTQTLTGKLADVDVAGTMQQINATLANAKEFTEKLNSNQGSLGKLMNDPSLYNHLNATIRDADSLMIDLKQHPKRYVHFSVFGRKDK
jgi:phospholipid/cholesterol/gamma-HCH transport system substrate-binding protein